jgi:hypothetical protein
VVHELGCLYDSQHRYSDAEDSFGRAVKGFEAQLGLDHESTMEATLGLGTVYVSQSRYDEAQKSFEGY